uniref:AA_permease domain-containing protein n=1 Tax=Panagrellus redivivus TaxID=6233 RepID=A0A7E4VZB3_PANRE
MKEKVDHHWGDYYMNGRRKGARKNWVLETIYTVNQMVPTFSEIFDEETFYVCAFLIVIAALGFVYVMTSIFRVRVREYPLNVDRQWRDWRPANPFQFPWQRTEEEPREHQD